MGKAKDRTGCKLILSFSFLFYHVYFVTITNINKKCLFQCFFMIYMEYYSRYFCKKSYQGLFSNSPVWLCEYVESPEQYFQLRRIDDWYWECFDMMSGPVCPPSISFVLKNMQTFVQGRSVFTVRKFCPSKRIFYNISKNNYLSPYIEKIKMRRG